MSGHPTREEDFDLVALGALEGDEKHAIELHVASCAACSAKLAEARGRMALLALAAPTVAPPAGVKQRLMSQIRADAQRDVRGDVPEAMGVMVPEKRGRNSSPKPSPGKSSARERMSGPIGWWTAVLIPASVALAIATFFLWNQNRQFDQQLITLRSVVEIQQQQLEDARQGAALVAAHDTIVVSLAQQAGMPKGNGRVMYNSRMGMLAYDGTLEPAPADKTYQLWLVPMQGNPISAGVFNPASGETSHWIMKLPSGIAPKAFAVTMEPSGGTKQPTGSMILVGPVS